MSWKGQTRNNISKQYLSDPQRFAQVCNNTLFGGQPVITPEGLSELDPRETKVMGLLPDETESVWKDRDILKNYQDQCILAIFGIENQTDIHYCMPLRALFYDALNYEEQRRQIQKAHDSAKDLRGAEYISGFAKTDRLLPVFTIVVYYGKKPWDGARTLHELLDLPESLEPHRDRLMDYHLNLVEINRMENLEQYDGELKAFFGFMKYRQDKNQLKRFVAEHQDEFGHLPYETIQAISIMGDMKELSAYLQLENHAAAQGRETVNMNEAWEALKEEWRQEGIEKGMQEGIQKGIRDLIAKKLRKGKSVETIAYELEESEDTVRAMIAEMNAEVFC